MFQISKPIIRKLVRSQKYWKTRMLLEMTKINRRVSYCFRGAPDANRTHDLPLRRRLLEQREVVESTSNTACSFPITSGQVRASRPHKAWFRSILLEIGGALALSVLAGCSTVPMRTVDNVAEGVFQAEHLVDTLQTYHGPASDACYAEGDQITRRIIGGKPSHAGVIAWGAGYAAVHFGVTELLLDHGHDYIAAAWEALTISGTAGDVAQNIHIGVRIGAPNVDPVGCHETRMAV